MLENTDKCLECENETMLNLSSLQVDFEELKIEYKALLKTFEYFSDFAVKKIKRLENKAEKCEMWHESFNEQSKKLDIFRNDPFFENLTLSSISELAKKSIKLTSENCDMLHDFEEVKRLLENIDQSKLSKDEKKMLDESIEFCKKYAIYEEE